MPVSQTIVKESVVSEAEESQGEALGPSTRSGTRLEAHHARDARQGGIAENTRKGNPFPFNHVFGFQFKHPQLGKKIVCGKKKELSLI